MQRNIFFKHAKFGSEEIVLKTKDSNAPLSLWFGEMKNENDLFELALNCKRRVRTLVERLIGVGDVRLAVPGA